MKLLPQIGLAVTCAWLLGACNNGDSERLIAGDDTHIKPVELILTEEGRPVPSILAEEQVLHRDNGTEPQTSV